MTELIKSRGTPATSSQRPLSKNGPTPSLLVRPWGALNPTAALSPGTVHHTACVSPTPSPCPRCCCRPDSCMQEPAPFYSYIGHSSLKPWLASSSLRAKAGALTGASYCQPLTFDAIYPPSFLSLRRAKHILTSGPLNQQFHSPHHLLCHLSGSRPCHFIDLHPSPEHP